MENEAALDPSAADSLTYYLKDIRSYAYLAADEEAELARRWHEAGDRQALDQLVGSHLRLVVKMARGFTGYGLPLSDLVSEGHVGLMRAAQKFDPGRGFRFATYARWWIRAEIQEYVLRSWSLVRMGTTAAQKKLFFNLRRLKTRMQAYEDGELSPETAAAIAEELDVAQTDVVDMNRRLGVADQSLNVTAGTEAGDERQDRLVEESADQETRVIERDERAWQRRLLARGLTRLSEREQQIIVKRKLCDEPITLQALGDEYGISRERVRQIEQIALGKLEEAVRDEARALSA